MKTLCASRSIKLFFIVASIFFSVAYPSGAQNEGAGQKENYEKESMDQLLNKKKQLEDQLAQVEKDVAYMYIASYAQLQLPKINKLKEQISILEKEIADRKKEIADRKAQAAVNSYKKVAEVLSEENLVAKGVIGKDIKDFFEMPKGNQVIVHQMKEAIRKNDLKKIEKLLRIYPKVLKLKDAMGYTPLLQAVFTNKIEIVKLLVSKGADFKAGIVGADGKLVTAVELATLLGYKNMASLLRSYEVDKNAQEALNKDSAAVISKKLESLIEAIKENDIKRVQEVLNPAIANMVAQDGKTPLMVAALKGNKDIVVMILDQIDDARQQDKNGNTALHWAVINGYYEVADLLVEKALLSIKNKKNLTALDLALQDKRKGKGKDEFIKKARSLR